VSKTTVYLPADLKAALAREAEHRGVAEAELIRATVAAAVHRPAPHAGLFESDEPFAERVEEAPRRAR
jgi:hypothetical protein